ncbi:MAG TPA: Uma2 family endonuclease, partial [Rhodopila sp.]
NSCFGKNAQELRWEFDGFTPTAMTGGTLEHSAIERNLIFALTGRLHARRYQAYTSKLKIPISGSVRYPDPFVACSPLPRGTLVVTDPVVVFEVLSPSTASTDIGAKNEECRDTPSIQRYVMLARDRQSVTVFARAGDDWVGHIVSGDAVLAMPEIGFEIPIAKLYEGVPFEPAMPATG